MSDARVEGGVSWWNPDLWDNGDIKVHARPPFGAGIRKAPFTEASNLNDFHPDAKEIIVAYCVAKNHDGFERINWAVASMEVPPGTSRKAKQRMVEAFLDIVRLRLGPKLEKYDE